jgi:hypothetical protein
VLVRIERQIVGLSDPSGKPEKPPELSWYDYAVMLLQIGASIEHALMVQYLYAAYSLRDDHAKAKKWRKILLAIAREEMGHLLTVQNILTLLGGPFNLDRGDYPWDVPFEACPFRLEPLTKGSLACYVYAEMPPGEEIKTKLKDIKKTAEQHIKDTSPHRKADTHVGHVGTLYDYVIKILGDREKVPDVCFKDSEIGQFSWDEWGRNYRGDKGGRQDANDGPRANVLIRKVATREEALIALAELSEQGEGLVAVEKGLGDTDILRNLGPNIPKLGKTVTHFKRFHEVYEELRDLGHREFSWNVPANPTTDRSAPHDHKGITPDGRTKIQSERSLRWAALFNLRYRMLLAWLAHALILVRREPSRSSHLCGQIVHRVFGEMYNIKAIAEMIVKMPLTDDPDDKRHAGPPFEMPFRTPLPPRDRDVWEIHKASLAAVRNLYPELLKAEHPKVVEPSGKEIANPAVAYLKAMKQADQDADQWIDGVLIGLP